MTTYLIREMPEGDRPRERLQRLGVMARRQRTKRARAVLVGGQAGFEEFEIRELSRIGGRRGFGLKGKRVCRSPGSPALSINALRSTTSEFPFRDFHRDRSLAMTAPELNTRTDCNHHLCGF